MLVAHYTARSHFMKQTFKTGGCKVNILKISPVEIIALNERRPLEHSVWKAVCMTLSLLKVF